MSEYWVSHKRYHCKYCNIYIADDVPSRQHHENGMRHKGNVERFVRGLYKAGEKAIKDKEEEKREMERIEKAAAVSYAQNVNVGGGVGLSPCVTPAAAPAPKKPPPKPSNPYANYSTAASLGYSDPDAERAKAEAEMRQTMGVAGVWQFVPSPALVRSEVASAAEDASRGTTEFLESDNKREAPVDERDFKLRKKTVDIGLGELYDPGDIPIKLKVKKEELVEAQADVKAEGADEADSRKMKIEWKRAVFEPAVDELTVEDVKVDSGGESALEVKMEEENEKDSRIEITVAAPTTTLFRKRKRR